MATMSEKEITLTELLESRDRRRMRQIELLGEYSGRTLVLLTIVTPGSFQRTSLSLPARLLTHSASHWTVMSYTRKHTTAIPAMKRSSSLT